MPSINDPRWVQNCFANSQMDCYYFGCLKKETCDKFKKLDSKNNIKPEKK